MLGSSPKRKNKTSIRILKVRDANIARRVEQRKMEQEAQERLRMGSLLPQYVSKQMVFLRFTFVKENRTRRRFF